jgi:hypothetical protein
MNQPIDPVALYYEFDKEPFHPRRVHLIDGGTIDIVSRQHVMIGEDFLDIGIQAPGEEFGICDSLETIRFSEIAQFELLPLAPQSAS